MRDFENLSLWKDRTLITASSSLLSPLFIFLFTPSTWYATRSRSSPDRHNRLAISDHLECPWSDLIYDHDGADQGLVPDLPQFASDDDRSGAGRRTSGTCQGDQGVDARAFGLRSGRTSRLTGTTGRCCRSWLLDDNLSARRIISRNGGKGRARENQTTTTTTSNADSEPAIYF
jgi:hypothetical protein